MAVTPVDHGLSFYAPNLLGCALPKAAVQACNRATMCASFHHPCTELGSFSQVCQSIISSAGLRIDSNPSLP